MSSISYISLPKALNAFLLSDIKDKEEDYGIIYNVERYRKDIYLFSDVSPDESAVIIADKKDASFDNCFINKFVYELCGGSSHDLIHQSAKILASDMNEEAKQHEMKKLHDLMTSHYSRSLYDFVHKHIAKGEFVEIYRVLTDHINFNFDSPKREFTINLDDFLSPFDASGAIEYMKFIVWDKFTIIKTKD